MPPSEAGPGRPLERLSSASPSADRASMRIMYVETCPECECALVRSKTGERRPSAQLMAGCTGCECHDALPLASSG
jgi:hypothetical protein